MKTVFRIDSFCMKGGLKDLLIWSLTNSNSSNHIVTFENSFAKAILMNKLIKMCH